MKMTAKIGDNVLALEPKKQSAVAKAVKNAQLKGNKKGKPAVTAEASKYRRGIILLKHIPHGFFENEMREYFAQFGKVLRIRLARSKLTGRSKGYAFIEFEFEEVAKIAAECMDGYLMYERLLKCEIVSSEENPNKIFSSRYIREDNYPKMHSRIKMKAEQSKTQSEEKVKEFLQFRLRKLEEQNKKLAEMGIEYKFEIDGAVDKKVVKSASPKSSTPSTSTAKMEKKSRESEIPKFSPKFLRNRNKSGVPTPAQKEKKIKTPDNTPKPSPKLLQKKNKSGSDASISTPTRNHPEVQLKKKTPEKPKFSPKLLRSRNKSGAPASVATKKVQKDKTPDKMPKFSPKLLRSRKSDVSGLTPRVSPKNKKMAGRKSVR